MNRTKDKHLRVLIIEDSQDDLQLILRHFKRNEYKIDYKNVCDAAGFKKSIRENGWDVIVSDYKLPEFSVDSAMTILKENQIDLPFIIISGVISEEIAVEAMLAGAHDFIRKDNLSRLIPAIEREIIQAENRAENRRMHNELIENEERNRILLKTMNAGVMMIDPENRKIVEINPAAERMFGRSSSEVVGKVCHEFICPAETGKCPVIDLRQVVDNSERILVNNKGRHIPIIKTVRPLKIKGKKYLLENFVDISDRIKIENDLRRSKENYRILTENSIDIIWTTDLKLKFTYVSPSIKIMTGYSQEEFIGTRLSQHATRKEFMQMARYAIRAIKNFKALDHLLFESKLLRKNGEEFPVEIIAKVLYNEKNRPVGFTGSTRDISERYHAEENRRLIYHFQGLISKISKEFINLPIGQIDAEIERALKQIIDFLEIDCAFMLQIDAERFLMKTHDSCRKAEEKTGVFEDQNFIEKLPYLENLFTGHEEIIINNIDDLPTEAQEEILYFQHHGVKSLLLTPMIFKDALLGFLCFLSTEHLTKWSLDAQQLLRVVSDIIGSTLMRRKSEEKEVELLEQNLAVNRLALALGKTINPQQIYYTIYENVSRSMDADLFSISFYDSLNNHIKRGFAVIEEEVIDLKYLPSINLNEENAQVYEKVIETGGPVYIEDFGVDRNRLGFELININVENGDKADSIYKANSALFVPMLVHGELIGIMEIQSSRYNAYSQHEIDLFDAMANMATLLIRNARLVDDLHKSEQKFRNVIEQSNDAIFLLFNGTFELVNKRFSELFNISAEEINSGDFNITKLITPESMGVIKDIEEKRKRGESIASNYVFTALTATGEPLDVEASVSSISYKYGTAVLGIIRDISERKRLEQQLNQAMRMEAIGRLAGGVAHDFNNILTVILGHTEMTISALDSRDPLREDMNEILAASNRASNLTRQLLAFSRRQNLESKVIDLNYIINDLSKMLLRVIGEDVELQIDLDPNLHSVFADPGQLEQVMINMAVNARDAMLGGGRLKIATSNIVLNEGFVDKYEGIPAGNYVMIKISDNGTGMSKEVKERIFEPFFTTKKEGKGTGLGLASVYGIVKQSGGFIDLETEVDKGTTFSIYLPFSDNDLVMPVQDELQDILPTGTESILIVEDEQGVRKLTSKILKSLGYEVEEAENAGEALLIAQKTDKKFDLILTDVVMPHMNGFELIDKLQVYWKDMKVLYMSGYSPESVDQYRKQLTTEVVKIQKPFSKVDIAWKVRRALDK